MKFPVDNANDIKIGDVIISFEKILLVGCGKMGGALLENWRQGSESFTIVDPNLTEAPDGVRLVAGRGQIEEETFDVVVVAIKPQMIGDVMPDYADMVSDGGYALSIAAGASLDRIGAAMKGTPVVRVMPNLPAAIGKATSGVCPGVGLSEAQQAHAMDLMRRAGSAVLVESEDKLDRVTAVAGSGPGYVFEIARTYVEAAKELGFDDDDARTLVLGTLEGTIAMAIAQSESELEDLRNSVTSKGGTTAAGLGALNGDESLSRLMKNTLQAAYDRAVELR